MSIYQHGVRFHTRHIALGIGGHRFQACGIAISRNFGTAEGGLPQPGGQLQAAGLDRHAILRPASGQNQRGVASVLTEQRQICLCKEVKEFAAYTALHRSQQSGSKAQRYRFAGSGDAGHTDSIGSGGVGDEAAVGLDPADINTRSNLSTTGHLNTSCLLSSIHTVAPMKRIDGGLERCKGINQYRPIKGQRAVARSINGCYEDVAVDFVEGDLSRTEVKAPRTILINLNFAWLFVIPGDLYSAERFSGSAECNTSGILLVLVNSVIYGHY